jgi:hypothetical protein
MSYITLKGCWCDITAVHVHAPTFDKSDDTVVNCATSIYLSRVQCSHTATFINTLWHEPSSFDVEIIIEELRRYKSPCTDQIPAELIKSKR